MRQYLLYLVAPSELESTRKALKRLTATEVPGPNNLSISYELEHRFLGGMQLKIDIMTDIDGVTPFMRQFPVDLLVYDERGKDWHDAIEATKRITTDVKELRKLWGPDFHFPIARLVTVLQHDEKNRAFTLGRMQVRNVLVKPNNTALLLRWLMRILTQDIARENKVGIAMSGGGIEGFLYQLGVIEALRRATLDRNLNDCDVISGVSSGSIAGGMLATKVDTREMIQAINGNESIYPALKSDTIFDLAAIDIVRRILKESISLKNINPATWLDNILKCIPTGIFRGDRLQTYISDIIATQGIPETFDTLDKEFFVGATDQDSFEHVTFSRFSHPNIDASSAIRASCAFPMVFAPKTIEGRRYIDGQVTKSCDVEIVVERGCRLVFVIDPLKPLMNSTAGLAEGQGGIFGIFQTLKGLCSSRFEANLKYVSDSYPDVDFLVFQPDDECAKLMAGSPMRYRIRTKIIESAYRGTFRKLRERHHAYSIKMNRYGFHLREPHELRKLEQEYDQIFGSSS